MSMGWYFFIHYSSLNVISFPQYQIKHCTFIYHYLLYAFKKKRKTPSIESAATAAATAAATPVISTAILYLTRDSQLQLA